jgi:hypothetical protein
MRFRIAAALVSACFALGCSGGAAPQGNPVELERLSFVLPADWQQVPPSSPMRAAQAMIPGADGAAEMAVFYFGAGQGGDVEANLQRWIGQVAQDADRPPQRATFENAGLRITWVDVHGTLQPGQMGMGPKSPQPNSRLLGAVIEGDGGPWFVKVTGPETTLSPQREAFMEMLRSAKRRG